MSISCSGRWGILLLLLVLVLAATTATCWPSLGKHKQHRDKKGESQLAPLSSSDDTKSQEELDFEAARRAYKDLFVQSSSQSVESVLEKLEALTKVQGRGDIHAAPLDYHLLLGFNQTEEAKCESWEYVSKLKEVYEIVEREYKPLRRYLHDCLQRQLAVCNFVERFREQLDNFKQQSPQQWALIQDFNRQASKLGKRDSDWQTDALDNRPMLNEALERLARDTVQPGQDPARNAYELVLSLRQGCANFDGRLAAGLLMTTIDGKLNRKNKEIKEWYRLMAVCRQVGRVSFERSLGDIFGYTYYPGMQRAWERYEDFRERWAR